jgi:hypothetical protein
LVRVFGPQGSFRPSQNEQRSVACPKSHYKTSQKRFPEGGVYTLLFLFRHSSHLNVPLAPSGLFPFLPLGKKRESEYLF